MTDQDFKLNSTGRHQLILSAAIRQAIDGGWTADLLGGAEDWQDLTDLERRQVIRFLINGETGDGYKMIIFDHDFARALWGEEKIIGFPSLPRFKIYLQQMVIADNPIAYLGRTLGGDHA